MVAESTRGLRGEKGRSHSWRVRAHGEVFLRISGGAPHATIGHLTDKVTVALNNGDYRGQTLRVF